jgi:hypothetical protein
MATQTAVLKVQPDPTVQKTVLDILLQAAENGQQGSLIASGLDSQVLDALRHLRGLELSRLVQRDLGFTLTISNATLSHQIGILKNQLETQRLIEEFALRGCPTPLFTRLFKLNKRNVIDVRERLGINLSTTTLQPATNADKRAIEDAWIKLRPPGSSWTHPSPESIKLEQRSWQNIMRLFPHISLLTLYSTVARFERLGSDETPSMQERQA